MSDHKAYFTSVDSDIVRPQPKKQKTITKAIPKKAANSKASSKPRKAPIPRNDSVTTNKVERANQRKVVYGCFLQPDAEVNVLTLACRISTKLVYYHGPQSLTSTIIGLAQNFVGANNVNLLAPLACATHHINTCLEPITRLLFHKDDMALLNYLDDDGIKVEPEWFVPVMPIILLNGYITRWTWLPTCGGSCRENPLSLWYLGFTGDIEPSGPNRYMMRGRITKLNNRCFEITELPIGTWMNAYTAILTDWCLNSDMIEDYEQHHSIMGVRYIIWVSEASMKKLEKEDLYAKFKLKKFIYTSNLVCFDMNNRIKHYASAEEILTEFYNIRLQFYYKRLEDLVSKLMQEHVKISNQARFIHAVINEEFEICNFARAALIKKLIEMEFDPINTEDDDGATDSGFKYLIEMEKSSSPRQGPLNLWNADLDLFLKLWEDMVENWLAFGQRVASKLKLKKETKPKGLACSDSTSK
ncbi:DNA topoisomerase 2 [Massospora cicadina]|nr:DNA topoisomerase 2 [Massospora cicadina]